MKTNNDDYKPIEDGELLGGCKGEVYCWIQRREYNLKEYPELYKKLKSICLEYFSKIKK